METKKHEVVLELITKMLGTAPKDPEVYSAYVATKKAEFAKNTGRNAEAAVDETTDEEVGTLSKEVEERGWTGFHQDENGLFIYEYMVKGFFKTALEVLVENGAIKKIPAYKKWIDRMVFVTPRRLYVGKMEPDGAKERPLRTMTPKGERVTLAKSDYLAEGTRLKFTVEVLQNTKGIKWETIASCLEYGAYVGLGQWRGSGGYGRFEVVSITAL